MENYYLGFMVLRSGILLGKWRMKEKLLCKVDGFNG